MKRLLASLSLCLLATPAIGDDWPQFRGAGGLSVSDETGLPTKWSATQNLRWKVALPGRGLTNPVIANGRVYVTASSGYLESRLHVLCYEAESGKKLWERQFWSTGITLCHPKTCMAAPTPATDGERIYALFATCDLFALDAKGDLLWYRSLSRDYPTVGNNVGMASSPILSKDLLLIQMENAGESFVVGIDKRTGKNRWKIERKREINWATPILLRTGDREDLLLQSGPGVAAHDAATGKQRWIYKGGASNLASPVAGNGLIFAATGGVTAIQPSANGAEPKVVWSSNRLQSGYSSPVSYRDRDYAVNSAGVLNCVDARDGKPVWQQRVKGAYSASPVAADGKIYVVNEEGLTTVVETGDQPRILATNPLGETILATPAIADGAIYLRSDQHLFCISERK